MATVKRYLIVRREGARDVRREVLHYNLDVILAVGYQEGERASSSQAQETRPPAVTLGNTVRAWWYCDDRVSR